ncbi:MAG: IS110 family transposase [Gammaproteobacteria bacterium]|nr:MAG: IS110 family transposase [Gammaproteobacteria bacterium]
MNITTIGLDIAKNVFHCVCTNKENRQVKKKMLKRAQVLTFFQQQPECLVALEACATSHYWAREIRACGHQVKLIPAQHVKAFLIGNKNDYNDALAIAIAAKQPHIKSVEIKTIEQQDNQAQHKVRELAVRQRKSLFNQIRGLIAEYGISIAKGVSHIRHALPVLQDDKEERLSPAFKTMLSQLAQQLKAFDNCIDTYDMQIKILVKNNPICRRLQSVPGIGPMVASAYFNEVGNGSHYRKGRDVSASLGLVPKQYSSGGKDVLLGISKRGNKSLRCLLIQGAKSVVSRAKGKTDKLSLWINKLVLTRGHNRACVAYANKIARIAWAITVSGEEYSPQYVVVK